MTHTAFHTAETFHHVNARQLQAAWDAEGDRGATRRLIARVRAIHALRPAGEPPLLVGAALAGLVLFILPALALAAIGGAA